MDEITATIRKWNIQPFYGHVILTGEIYGDIHNRFEDGTIIRSSTVQEIDFTNRLVHTRNSTYRIEI